MFRPEKRDNVDNSDKRKKKIDLVKISMHFIILGVKISVVTVNLHPPTNRS